MANHSASDMPGNVSPVRMPLSIVGFIWLTVGLCFFSATWMFFSVGSVIEDYSLLVTAITVVSIGLPVFLAIEICVSSFKQDRSAASRIISILNDQLDRALRNREGRGPTIRRLAGLYFWSLIRRHIVNYYLPLIFLAVAIWLIQIKRLNNCYPHSLPSLANLSWPLWSVTGLTLVVAGLLHALLIPFHVKLVQTWKTSSLLSGPEETLPPEPEDHAEPHPAPPPTVTTIGRAAETFEEKSETSPLVGSSEADRGAPEAAQPTDEKKAQQAEQKPSYLDDADNIFIWGD